jgi:hypothetical protein
MRIEPGDQDARLGDAVFAAQVGMQDAQGALQHVGVMAAGTSLSGRWVVASATRSGPRSVSPASIMTTSGVPVFSARYSVWPVKWDTGLVDDALVHRRRRHRGKLAGLAAGQRAVEQGQHVGAVGRIELTGPGGGGQRNVQDVERLLAAGRNATVPDFFGQKSRKATFRPRAAARASSRLRSPSTTGCASPA